MLNYAYALELKSNAQIAFGLNLFAFSRKLATSYQPDPNIGLPILEETNDFILRLDPSLRFKLDGFSIGIVAENLFDYNFSTSEKDTGPMEKVYIGLASYNIPVAVFGFAGTSFIQPTVYLKTLPNYDNQFGINALFSTPKFWVQAGYNNFYGFSAGAGGRLFGRFSLGALMEFGTSNELTGIDPTFELISSYKLGPLESKQKTLIPEEEEEEEKPLITEAEELEQALKEEPAIDKKEEKRLEREAKLAERQERKDSVTRARAEQKMAVANARATERMQDSVSRELKRQNLIEAEKLAQQRQDSIAASREMETQIEAKRLAEQQSRDSLERARIAGEEQARILALKNRQDSINEVQRAQELAAIRAAEQMTKDSLAKVREQQRIAETTRIAAQKRQDSLDAIKQAEAIALANKMAREKTQDSLAEVRRQQRIAEAARIAAQKRKDSLDAVKKAEAIAQARKIAEEKTRDSLARIRAEEREAIALAREQKRIQDSLIQAKEAEALTQEQAVRDEVVEVEPEAGEKYEEAITEDGLEPGFYLIANVFGTKKYFDIFMGTLKDQGLRPKSFFRSLNKYNYVYLQRYDSITEARKARDTKFNGRYQGNTWIFRVVPQ